MALTNKGNIRKYTINIAPFVNYKCSMKDSSTIVRIIRQANSTVTPWIEETYHEAKRRHLDLKGYAEICVKYAFMVGEEKLGGICEHVSGVKERVQHPYLFFYLIMLQFADRLDNIHHRDMDITIESIERLTVILSLE